MFHKRPQRQTTGNTKRSGVQLAVHLVITLALLALLGLFSGNPQAEATEPDGVPDAPEGLNAFMAPNPEEGYGLLRVTETDGRPNPRDVVIYEALPNELPRVAGVITTVFQAPLSLVNRRAVPGGVPNAVIRDGHGNSEITDPTGGYAHQTASAVAGQDTTAPEVDAISITSMPGTDRVYGTGDRIEVTVTMTETVVVTGTPELTIEVGDKNRPASYRSNAGTKLVFGYKVVEGDEDTDGVSIKADSMSLNAGTIADSAENDALLNHDLLTADSAHRVDGIKPSLGEASANQKAVRLTYSEQLEADATPLAEDFSVTADSSPQKIAAVAVSESTVTLTLSSTLTSIQAVAVSYTPGTNPISDGAGNTATAFADEPVANQTQLNILLITVDDMNWDSVGVFGSPVEGATPNIDELAAEGMRFNHAHVAVAVCTPSRSAMMTGRHPHLSGGEGFHELRLADVPILPGILRDEGYDVGILGKVGSSTPYDDFEWDLKKQEASELGRGRNPDAFYQHAQQFIEDAANAARPFFLMANSSDPHRPLYGNDRSAWYDELDPPAAVPSRVFSPDEVTVPGFLPDLPEVRLEISEYYSGVRRADDTVGRLLDALEDEGVASNTLVVFMSDHGMAFPFAKSNLYLNSTRTPWIVRWPGVAQPASVNEEDLISAIDYLPTILESAGVAIPEGVNGRSLLPLMRGEEMDGRDYLFTQFYESAGGKQYPMRSIQDTRFGYIVNLWSDGNLALSNDTQAGRSWAAMTAAANEDLSLAERNDFYLHRTLQEFYDYENDPDALNNLMDDPDYVDEIENFRNTLEEWMEETNDPLLERFQDEVLTVKVANSPATGAPTISGELRVGETITTETNAIADADGLDDADFTYQWSITDQEANQPIPGATGSTYTPAPADEGKTIKVTVAFTDDRGKDEALASAATAPVAPRAPLWSANMSVVEYTSVSVGAATPDLFTSIGGHANLTVNSLWYHTPNRELRLDIATPIADTANLTLETDNLALTFPADGSSQRTFKWTDVDVDWQDGETIYVQIARGTPPTTPESNNSATGAPTISGGAWIGGILTADTSTIEDDDGLENAEYRYQWRADSTDIAGATGSTYTLTSDELGKTVQVRVSFTDDGGNAESLTSEQTTNVLNAWSTTMTVGTRGASAGYSYWANPHVGALTETQVTWDGNTHHVRFIYTQGGTLHLGLNNDLLSTGFILALDAHQFGSAYALVDHGGASYQFRWDDPSLAWTDGQGVSVSLVESSQNTPALGRPAITGNTRVGETLTADTSTIEDADGLENVEYRYQWESNDGSTDSDIPDATGPVYEPSNHDVGKTIKVRVSFTDDAGNAESLTSDPTSAVRQQDKTLFATMNVGESGGAYGYSYWTDPDVGNLSITEFQWDGKTHHVRFIYTQGGRLHLGLNEDLLSTGFVLSLDDHQFGSADSLVDHVGASYQFRWDDPSLAWTDGQGVSVSLVESSQNTPAFGGPAIAGNARVGETLTADTSNIEDADGLESVEYQYQWTADGTDIADATGSSYTLTSNEEGQTIQVRVSFTDDGDNEEVLTSPLTETVQKSSCPTGDYDATPITVEASTTPIVVASNTDEYFVLYVSVELDDGTTANMPVSVAIGQTDTTTLSENVTALPGERYRIEKYLVSDPADVDGDCIDDITELNNLGSMNPVNPATATSVLASTLAIPDQAAFAATADPYQNVKFFLVGMDTGLPSVYFTGTRTSFTHQEFIERVLKLDRSEDSVVTGEIAYDPNLTAPDGSLGLYYYWQNLRGQHKATPFSLGTRVHTTLAASMPVLTNNIAFYMPHDVIAEMQPDLNAYKESRINLVFDEDVIPETSFVALNKGTGYGILRNLEPDDRPNPRDVVIYEALPNDLPRVAGIITTVFQTPLSHVNLRAVQNSVPNAYIRDALTQSEINALIGRHVQYEVTDDAWTLRAATPAEVDAHYAAARPTEAQTPQRDLSVTEITALSDIEFDDWTTFGVKAANVAVLRTLGFPSNATPNGHAVPFYFYDEFMKLSRAERKCTAWAE